MSEQKEIYTKELGRLIANDALYPDKDKLHIINSDSNKWAVVSDGKIKPLRVFPTKQEAISFAKEYIPFGLIEVHNTDGTTASRINVGNNK